MPKRSRAAKLDREIAAVLRKSSHATVAEPWEPFNLPDWPVILDALQEHNPKKAAMVWQALQREEGGAPRPDSFIRKFRVLPKDIRWQFEDLTARTADRYLEALHAARHETKDPDALIEAVKAAKKHVAATKRVRPNGFVDTRGAFDPSMQELRNLLATEEKAVKYIKQQRKKSRH